MQRSLQLSALQLSQTLWVCPPQSFLPIFPPNFHSTAPFSQQLWQALAKLFNLVSLDGVIKLKPRCQGTFQVVELLCCNFNTPFKLIIVLYKSFWSWPQSHAQTGAEITFRSRRKLIKKLWPEQGGQSFCSSSSQLRGSNKLQFN